MDAWGKFDEGRIHRLEHHCADVAACFEALLRDPVLRARFVRAAGAVGFPAPAGMDPCRRRRGTAWTRIPRTRGDGPPFSNPFGGDLSGFPAPAGMGWLELHSDPGVRPEQEPRAGAEEEPLSEGRVQNRRRLRPEPLEGVGRVSAAAPADAAMAAPPVPGGRALIRPDARRA